jgi:hypothetical protein
MWLIVLIRKLKYFFSRVCILQVFQSFSYGLSQSDSPIRLSLSHELVSCMYSQNLTAPAFQNTQHLTYLSWSTSTFISSIHSCKLVIFNIQFLHCLQIWRQFRTAATKSLGEGTVQPHPKPHHTTLFHHPCSSVRRIDILLWRIFIVLFKNKVQILYLYVIVNRCNCHTLIVIHPLKTADWQSKARNNKYLKTRERLKTYYE